MPDCAKNILQAFERHPKADIITFALRYGEKKFANIEKEVKYVEAMKTSSLQIAFRRKKIQKHRLSFNIKMGSGTGNGGGEEIKFLFDCLKAGLVIWYVPIIIASIQDGSKSQWFKGFTRQYFFNKILIFILPLNGGFPVLSFVFSGADVHRFYYIQRTIPPAVY